MLIFFTIFFKYFDRHFAFINILFNFKNTIRSKRQFITFFIRMKKKNLIMLELFIPYKNVRYKYVRVSA